ncbi:oleate hydratase [Streptomyces sp. NPDC058623]|uniref:oleate hydratase n=1 Tax=Streptomyces sp. NPDC058623 TaxID=3346563 RepID=UPI00365FCE6D
MKARSARANQPRATSQRKGHHRRHRDRTGLRLAPELDRQPPVTLRTAAADQIGVWLYGLFTERPGDHVKEPMQDCTG